MAFKKISEIWNSMTEEQKQPYKEKQKADQERYTRQKEEFEKKGYYTKDDGTLSNAHEVKEKVSLTSEKKPAKKRTSKQVEAALKSSKTQ